MAIVLRNALLVDIDPPRVRKGSLRVEHGEIAAIDELDGRTEETGQVVDCSDRLILPGLVVGHTHLYSALAVGMPPPARPPGDFGQILEQIWWKLDRCLDEEAVAMSALVGGARAALCGVTTIVDHHASPNAIGGSLEHVRQALEDVGLRGVLCYEVSDRNGEGQAEQGVLENARYLQSVRGSRTFSGLVGAHASFTLGERSLARLAELADEFQVGVHIHCAEDPLDVEDCFRRTGVGLVQRLRSARILREGTLLAHCTHLQPAALAQAAAAGCWMAHNPRSNMNNAVGYAPVEQMDRQRIVLGTDGMDQDLFAESKVSYYKVREACTGLSGDDCLSWVAGSARFASRSLGTQLGRLEPGAAADLVVLDSSCSTPWDSSNVVGHWLFGLSAWQVQSVMVQGKWVVWQRQLVGEPVRRRLSDAPEIARKVWQRFARL